MIQEDLFVLKEVWEGNRSLSGAIAVPSAHFGAFEPFRDVVVT